MKKLITALCLIPVISIAGIDDKKEEDMKILAELGLPLPDSGIKIMPRALMGKSAESIKRDEQYDLEMREKGFIEESSIRPKELINFKAHAELQFKNYANNENNASTHIRHSLNNLKLAFTPKRLPSMLMASFIGTAPQGAYRDKGWTGAVQFFEAKDIGICAYAQMDVKSSHTAAELAQEAVTYSVSDKATVLLVKGSKTSGFDYDIRWFDDLVFHELECANMKYSADTTQSVINLAKSIDSYQQ